MATIALESEVKFVVAFTSKAVTHKEEASLYPRMSQTITVEGMSCEHCEQTVEDALEGVSGVESVDVDRDAEQATVDGDADPRALVDAVDEAGYDASA